MTDASPNSAQDLEIEIVEEESDDKDLDDEDKNEDYKEEKRKDKKGRADDSKDSKSDDDSSSTHSNERNGGGSKLKVCTSSTATQSIRSRVFVGHLNTDKATRTDLEKFFSQCGKIEAISMLNGYGFVQFDNEESARNAIAKYHGTFFFGTRLVVDKPAAWKKLDGENPRDPKPWPNKGGSRRSPDNDDRYERRRGRRDDFDSRHDDIPLRYRDPEYERYLEMRYMEERLADRYRYERLYDRYPPPAATRYPGDYLSYREMDRFDYSSGSRGYGYLRDDDFGRDRRPFDYSYR